jgi:hypothetical protein
MIFTTIAAQLAINVPDIVPFMVEAINLDPIISQSALSNQFERLILEPLSKISTPLQTSTLIIVIDALDECETENDIKTVLRVLARAKDAVSIRLRLFVTSRPELPIRLGFKQLSGDTHEDLDLQEIQKTTIEQDISTYLKHEFTKIRADYADNEPESPLSPDWPGDKSIEALVQMAVPLFIFAATICRFVADQNWNPKEQLKTIFESRAASQASQLDQTYLPVLENLVRGQNEKQKLELAKEFQEVVGTIVILAEPLSTSSLADLLGILEITVKNRLRRLHSVLSVPSCKASPVRLYHLSFREFLLDPNKRTKSQFWFWVDEPKTHERIASKCLELMSREGSLKEEICDLKEPGRSRNEVDRTIVDKCIPAHVQYACQY